MSMAVENMADGGVVYNPIPGDMIFSYNEDPQVSKMSVFVLNKMNYLLSHWGGNDHYTTAQA